METNKVKNLDLVIGLINKIYGISKDELDIEIGVDTNLFTLKFNYKNIIVKIQTYNEYPYGYEYYYGIDITKKVEGLDYKETGFETLRAYNDNKATNLNFIKEEVEMYLTELKGYIDNNKLILTYYTLDLQKRYIIIGDEVKELSKYILLNWEEEMRLSFGKDAYRLINNKVYYK